MADLTMNLLGAGALFLIASVLMFLVYYFTSARSIEFGDKNSRVIYSLVQSVGLALMLAIGLGVLPMFLSKEGQPPDLIVTLVSLFILVLAFTFLQVLLTRELIKRGIIKMRPKMPK